MRRKSGQGHRAGKGVSECVGDQNRGACPDHDTATGQRGLREPQSAPSCPSCPSCPSTGTWTPSSSQDSKEPSISGTVVTATVPGGRLLFGCKSLSLTRTQSFHLYNGVLWPTLLVGKAHREL